MSAEHLDVLIIGAGLSGIGAAYHLMKHCPGKRFAILEGRAALGGTWDLFRYPGIRSDSDMFTLGYNFKPWTNPLAIADGPSIRSYIEETAQENGIQEKIRFRHKVLKADWCSERATWTLQVQRGDDAEPRAQARGEERHRGRRQDADAQDVDSRTGEARDHRGLEELPARAGIAADDGEPLRQSGRFWLDRRMRPEHRLPTTRRSDTAERRAQLWQWCVEAAGVDPFATRSADGAIASPRAR